jgi:DNA (cytosine-5)-methyltransferase 1
MSGEIVTMGEQLELPLRFLAHRPQFTFVDLFAGIGGFRVPLEQLGGKCLGYSEIDKEAIKVYERNFINYLNATELSLGDITKIDNLPRNVDIITGGVPCQPWSVAGQLKGFEDPRGKLWFDVLRLVKKSQPQAFIFENVRGLANPKNQESFLWILEQFSQLDYAVKWQVINAYDFGLPQNRERVFIVGIRNDLHYAQDYKFPVPLRMKPKVIDIVDEIRASTSIEKIKLTPDILFGGVVPASRTRFQKEDELNDFFIFSDLRNGHTTIHSWELIPTSEREKEICLCILKNRRKKKYGEKDGNPLSLNNLRDSIPDLQVFELENLVDKAILRKTTNDRYEFVNSKNMSGINGIYRVILPHADIMPTLTATGAKDFIATVFINAKTPEEYKKKFIEKIYNQKKYIPITAQHACRLQGFPDWFIYHQKEDIAKKQFGNAVPVPVVYHVTQALLKILQNQIEGLKIS